MNKLKFTEKNYNRYDNIAKQKAIEFLQSRKCSVLPSDNELYCDGDLYVIHKESQSIILVEVEVKSVWNGKHFPYSTIHVPHRKSKSKSNLFIMFNNDLTCLFVTKMTSILNSKIIYKNTLNRYTKIKTEKEPFFEFNISQAKFYIHTNLIWTHYENRNNGI